VIPRSTHPGRSRPWVVLTVLATVYGCGARHPAAGSDAASDLTPPEPIWRTVSGRYEPRRPTITLLANGGLLLTGGEREQVPVGEAKRFLPERNELVVEQPMRTRRRYKHDATRLADGRVLVCGGEYRQPPTPEPFFSEVFDPSQPVGQRWRDVARSGAFATSVLLATGEVLRLYRGGLGVGTTSTPHTRFDPQRESWTELHTPGKHELLFDARAFPAPDGGAYAVGGILVNSRVAGSRIEYISGATGHVKASWPLKKGRHGAGVARVRESAFMLVGAYDTADPQGEQTGERIDLLSGEHTLFSLPEKLSWIHAIALPSGNVWVLAKGQAAPHRIIQGLIDRDNRFRELSIPMPQIDIPTHAELLKDGSIFVLTSTGDAHRFYPHGL
jgi:hypothetical protein